MPGEEAVVFDGQFDDVNYRQEQEKVGHDTGDERHRTGQSLVFHVIGLHLSCHLL